MPGPCAAWLEMNTSRAPVSFAASTTARVPSTLTARSTIFVAGAHQRRPRERARRCRQSRARAPPRASGDSRDLDAPARAAASYCPGRTMRAHAPAGAQERRGDVPAEKSGRAGEANRAACHTCDTSCDRRPPAASMPALTSSLSSSVHDSVAAHVAVVAARCVDLGDQQRIQADLAEFGQHAEQDEPAAV